MSNDEEEARRAAKAAACDSSFGLRHSLDIPSFDIRHLQHGAIMTKVLERPTLVLNRNWQPVNVAAVARALVLVWNDSAKVAYPEDYRLYTWAACSHCAPRAGDLFIQAVRQRLRVPEVISLSSYDRLPIAAVSFSRRNI